MNKDIIANLITSIRNADMNRKEIIRIKSTTLTESIIKILYKEGFLTNIRKHSEGKHNFLVLTLRHRIKSKKLYYKNILNFKQISRPGLRIYYSYKKIPEILGNMIIGIISTSQGIITDREAQSKRIGGELLCCIW
uniref:Small ribosomal subunit protein uS8c n=1 Tax=Cytinus hypocistis TaxID=327100 RepID=A0A1B0VB13_9ROSI|nr:ribosomal protein S8 [Cytinus hypocistis]AMR36137.1 ribosomal protein S8 [Cytinus hypocistis]